MIFSRQVSPVKTNISLNSIVENALSLLESRCTKQGIVIIRSLSQNIPEIVADPSQINQVLVNLIVNALQAMPNGGKLKIATSLVDNFASVVVEDTGIGMSQEIMKKIFLPFFTTKGVGQGTGLGLSVVHGIVTSHGGKINVKSEAGKGSRFEVLIPLSQSNKKQGGNISD